MVHAMMKHWNDDNIIVSRDDGSCPCNNGMFDAKVHEFKEGKMHFISIDINVNGYLYSISVMKPKEGK